MIVLVNTAHSDQGVPCGRGSKGRPSHFYQLFQLIAPGLIDWVADETMVDKAENLGVEPMGSGQA